MAQARARLSGGGSVILTGPAGIGKSTILDALALEATDVLVLRAAAAEAEAELPYLALVDLLDGAPDAFDLLPPHLRAALDGALLRSALPSTAHDQLAVRLAVLELLRALSADRPLLLVLDDVQWIDEPSAEVLRFVARRLEGVDVSVLAAERLADGGAATRLDLCPPPYAELGRAADARERRGRPAADPVRARGRADPAAPRLRGERRQPALRRRAGPGAVRPVGAVGDLGRADHHRAAAGARSAAPPARRARRLAAVEGPPGPARRRRRRPADVLCWSSVAGSRRLASGPRWLPVYWWPTATRRCASAIRCCARWSTATRPSRPAGRPTSGWPRPSPTRSSGPGTWPPPGASRRRRSPSAWPTPPRRPGCAAPRRWPPTWPAWPPSGHRTTPRASPRCGA